MKKDKEEEKDLTVLVLGAGVSVASGFPDGKQLVDILIEWTKSGATYDYSLLHKTLANARPYSIDAFLENHPKFQQYTAQIIQHILLTREHSDSLMKNPFLRNLFQVLHPSDFPKVKIITFNYDRSLETYLSRFLPAFYGFDEERTRSTISSLEIHHVHGQVYPYQVPDGKRTVIPYAKIGSNVLIDGYDNVLTSWANENFKFVFNGDRKSVPLEWLDRSRQLFFLGFGYDFRNLDFLNQDEVLDKQPGGMRRIIAGTSLGMTRIRLENIKKKYRLLNIFYDEKAELFFESSANLLDYDMNLKLVQQDIHYVRQIHITSFN